MKPNSKAMANPEAMASNLVAMASTLVDGLQKSLKIRSKAHWTCGGGDHQVFHTRSVLQVVLTKTPLPILK